MGKVQIHCYAFRASQRSVNILDVVLQGTSKFTRCYIDDISFFSQNWTDHLVHIREVLSKLERAGLTLQLKKCTFGSDYCEFLGHQVGAGKISPQTAKTEAAANYQQPRTKTDIRSFLGLAGYYRWYIPNFSAIAAPLSDCTKTSASEKIEWTEDCKKAFESLKNALILKPTLVPPNYSNQFILHTDASNQGIGAVLSQGNPKEDNAIGYFSRKLLSREKNYSATEKEGLAVVAACKHFLPYLLGRHFTIVTDHRVLKFLTSKDSSSSRIARWMDSLRDLVFEVRYHEGITNGNADGMSRQAWLEDDDESLKEGEVLGSPEDDYVKFAA